MYILVETTTDPFTLRAAEEPIWTQIKWLLALKWLNILVWAKWLLPALLEAFALPPYLTANELELLIDNIKDDDAPKRQPGPRVFGWGGNSSKPKSAEAKQLI